jgi:PAS domain-containing protein
MVQLLGEQMGMGFWRFVARIGVVYWSRRVFEIYGLVFQDAPLTLPEALSVIVDEDRKRAAEILQQTLVEKRSQKYVQRADTANGVKLIECTIGAAVGTNGEVTEVFGTILDITGKATPDAGAVGRSLLLRALMKNIPAAIAVFDKQMNYVAVSDFWVSGHNSGSARDLIGKNHYKLRPDLSLEHKAEHRRVLAGETVHSPRSYTRDRHGKPIRQTCVMCPWHTADGAIGGMLMMLGRVDLETPPTGLAATRELPTKGELLDILKEVV